MVGVGGCGNGSSDVTARCHWRNKQRIDISIKGQQTKTKPKANASDSASASRGQVDQSDRCGCECECPAKVAIERPRTGPRAQDQDQVSTPGPELLHGRVLIRGAVAVGICSVAQVPIGRAFVPESHPERPPVRAEYVESSFSRLIT